MEENRDSVEETDNENSEDEIGYIAYEKDDEANEGTYETEESGFFRKIFKKLFGWLG